MQLQRPGLAAMVDPWLWWELGKVVERDSNIGVCNYENLWGKSLQGERVSGGCAGHFLQWPSCWGPWRSSLGPMVAPASGMMPASIPVTCLPSPVGSQLLAARWGGAKVGPLCSPLSRWGSWALILLFREHFSAGRFPLGTEQC